MSRRGMLTQCANGFGAVALARGALVPESKAVEALQKSGYTDVKIRSSAWLVVGLRGCSEKDAAMFRASAINSAGQRVDDIIVCSGWPLKGMTVRF